MYTFFLCCGHFSFVSRFEIKARETSGIDGATCLSDSPIFMQNSTNARMDYRMVENALIRRGCGRKGKGQHSRYRCSASVVEEVFP